MYVEQKRITIAKRIQNDRKVVNERHVKTTHNLFRINVHQTFK